MSIFDNIDYSLELKEKSIKLDPSLFDMSDPDTHEIMKKELDDNFKKNSIKEISTILSESRKKDLYIKTLEKCEELEKIINIYKYILVKSGIYYDIDESLNNILYYAYEGIENKILSEIDFIINEIKFANLSISIKHNKYIKNLKLLNNINGKR